jgi:hypothetical protein
MGATMRRRLELVIPIVLFAVMVQLLAPISGFRAVAQAISDPIAMAPICSGMMEMDRHTAPSGMPDDHGKCCAFCAAGHSAPAVVEPPAPIFVHLQRQYQRVVWLESIDLIPAVRTGSNAQARAPPIFS